MRIGEIWTLRRNMITKINGIPLSLEEAESNAVWKNNAWSKVEITDLDFEHKPELVYYIPVNVFEFGEIHPMVRSSFVQIYEQERISTEV